ncbi:hypothetical protein KEM56_006475 [Ascosphaera pollenicola]|nr:hypothetical protein KEM56_006475 [Ascosphaera pollenicola]
MFNIPIPITAWLSALFKFTYDRELAISGRSVKPYDILHNSSHILGRQTIQILPEGSAVLNPERTPFCLDSPRSSVSIPIRVNQTSPILIELLRFDLETGENETITINAKQAKQMKRQADRYHSKSDTDTPRDLMFSVKKTGVYQLRRVVDDSKLEVRRRPLDTLVVNCPKARFSTSSAHRCKGELSDLAMLVEGTPPLKVKYSRKRNGLNQGESIQSIQPEFFRSPLISPFDLKSFVDPAQPELQWAQSQQFRLPLNETLSGSGEWVYIVEEVHDGSGNIINYTQLHDDYDRLPAKNNLQVQQFDVHERPRISLEGCNAQSFIEAPKGKAVDLPVKIHSVGDGIPQDGPYSITYSFSNDSQMEFSTSELHKVVLDSTQQRPRIQNPGWYALNSVKSKFCAGEIYEPSSCYLHNPPEPSLAIRHDKLHDKCADLSVGLHVDLDLLGTPPFRLTYTVETARGVKPYTLNIDTMRSELMLTPSEAGHYRYEFIDIADSIYGPQSLKGQVPILEQDVRPPASAEITAVTPMHAACFGETVTADVMMYGEAPWTLDYEIVHRGKRVHGTIESDSPHDFIETDVLKDGGEYVIALTGIRDKTNCKRSLKDQVKFNVRPRRPRAAFGEIDKKRTIWALEDRPVDIPIRLEGVAPFLVKIKNLHDESAAPIERVLLYENSVVTVQKHGLYELISTSDATCPGSIDKRANQFEVKWIARPKIITVDGKRFNGDEPYVKEEVCENDEQVLELGLEGHPPYILRYEEQRKPQFGATTTKVHELEPALNSASIRLDTSRAGDHTYKLVGLGDNLYNINRKGQSSSAVIQQRVNPRPSARFESPNHVYGFCKEGAETEDLIPVVLEGQPPFALEVAVKHHSSAKPEAISIPHIDTNNYLLSLPRHCLHLGQHEVTIHKVRDSRGCQRNMDLDGSAVKVVVSDIPTIIPLESQTDYCVGERISFSLSGHAPFDIFYDFNDIQRKAHVQNTIFRRIAEQPGRFTITGVSDNASGKCKAHTDLTKIIHEMPSVRISQGANAITEIHEGGEVDIMFDFWGTPPFEFTYTRSSIAWKNKKSEILDTKQDISYEHTKVIRASDEGTYEVVAIKDKYCSFSIQDTGRDGARRQ